MPTRRKYKDGGRVSSPEKASADVPSPTPAPADDDAVARAAAATLRAEHLQRQAQQPPRTVQDQIDRIDGISDHKRSFLKKFPGFVTDGVQRSLLQKNYQEALAAGVADDTAEMDHRVLTGVARDLEAMKQRQALAAATPQQVPPPMPPLRRSMPITAPVSRDVPTASGEYSSSKVKLTPDEIDMAHRSFRHLRPDLAELEYAKNKSRMIRLKAEGVIQGDR